MARKRGLIRTTSRLKELCPSPAYNVWVTSGTDLYRATLKKIAADGKIHITLYRIEPEYSGEKETPAYNHTSYPKDMGLDLPEETADRRTPRSTRIFSLREFAEKHLESSQ